MEHVAHVKQMRNLYKILIGKLNFPWPLCENNIKLGLKFKMFQFFEKYLSSSR